MNKINPRGIKRPQNGGGQGIGRVGGIRQGKNTGGCEKGVGRIGFGQGGGRGKGKNRKG